MAQVGILLVTCKGKIFFSPQVHKQPLKRGEERKGEDRRGEESKCLHRKDSQLTDDTTLALKHLSFLSVV